MIPAAFEYASPSTLEEAVSLLATHGDDAKILAGGHSLIPLMRLRLAAPEFLVDLGKIPELRYIRDDGQCLAIGAMTTHYDLQSSSLVLRHVPLLSHAAGMVGDMQVRHRGTIGGSLAHADPASDLPAVVVALNAEILAQGPGGSRSIAAVNFFRDIWTSALATDEIVTEVRVPYGGRIGQTYQKFRQRAADWAIVGVAVNLRYDRDVVKEASIVLTNVGSTPLPAESTTIRLRGQSLTRELIRTASERASDGLDPTPELKASSEYKKHLSRVLTRRALESVLQSA